MTLRFDDRWIWDFWLTWDGRRHHVFYLQAPKSIGDPEARHWNVSIGHATSADLCHWTPVADAFGPGTPGAFDDFTTWTGSNIEHNGHWAMFYTGTARSDNGLRQRIGLATSPDLYVWTRNADPVLEVDPRFYETLSDGLWHDEAWRDPWVFADKSDGHTHMLFTARANQGERFDRGVIGHARSTDLRSWEVLEPLASQPGFGQMEVPQLEFIDPFWYLVFASDVETQAPSQQAKGTGTGTYYLVSESPYGPFTMLADGILESDRTGSSYAGRIHRTVDGKPWFLAWNRLDGDGTFVGELGEPRLIEPRSDGSLELRDTRPTP